MSINEIGSKVVISDLTGIKDSTFEEFSAEIQQQIRTEMEKEKILEKVLKGKFNPDRSNRIFGKENENNEHFIRILLKTPQLNSFFNRLQEKQPNIITNITETELGNVIDIENIELIDSIGAFSYTNPKKTTDGFYFGVSYISAVIDIQNHFWFNWNNNFKPETYHKLQEVFDLTDILEKKKTNM